MNAGDWYYSPEHGQFCRGIEAQTLWGETVCRVWLLGQDTLVGVVPAALLRPVQKASVGSGDEIAYLAAACKIPASILHEAPKLLMWHDQAVKRMGGN